jgi:hypothetical protein
MRHRPALRQLILELALHHHEGLGKEGIHMAEHPVAATVTPV